MHASLLRICLNMLGLAEGEKDKGVVERENEWKESDSKKINIK